MAHQLEKMGDSETWILRLDAVATLENAGTTREFLLEALATGGTLVLDLSRVKAADLSFLQLLSALRKSASKAGKSVFIRHPGPSSCLRELAYEAGFGVFSGDSPEAVWLGFGFEEEKQ